jgi:lipoyl(octanoyl) transferase
MIIRKLGIQDYEKVWNDMREFTKNRNENTEDELWILEHNPIYTQGQAGKSQHILNSQNIKVVQTDRGGQVTYHGPGQLVAYILMNITAKKLGVRNLVCKLEEIIINTLKEYNINACRKEKAPGVYIGTKKIASIGLRIKNGCSYHGVAINVNPDLSPFKGINPCGFENLEMTKVSDHFPKITMENFQEQFLKQFWSKFNS